MGSLSDFAVRRRHYQGIDDPLWPPFCDVVELRGLETAKSMFSLQVTAWPPIDFAVLDPIWKSSAIAAHMGKGLNSCGLATWLGKANVSLG